MTTANQNMNGDESEPIIHNKVKNNRNEDDSGPLYSLNPDLKAFLNLVRLPASLNSALTAGLLGFKPHDIPVLIKRGFLKPLGNPKPNCEKFFARIEIEELATDAKWLGQARAALNQHWRIKNNKKSKAANRNGGAMHKT